MTHNGPANRISCRGFSLVEMAIVLAIIGLLLAGLLPSLSGQVDRQRREETKKQLEVIQQALIGYAMVNGKLPRPASPTVATGNSDAGKEDPSLMAGVLPWVTLGVDETDAWGRRFTYSVSSTFASTFSLSTTGNITIKSLASGGTDVATGVPAVVVSHGSNGAGAYTTQGSQISSSSDADEAENSDGDTTFVHHDVFPTYDDMLVWISPNILFNRMVAAGKLP